MCGTTSLSSVVVSRFDESLEVLGVEATFSTDEEDVERSF